MTSFSSSRGAVISGTGSALPSRLVTNSELGALLGHTVAEQIGEEHGVLQRYWCGPDESTADLAEEAARAALAAAKLNAHDIGLLVVATDSPEFVTPPTSAVVHGRLELANAHAIDVSAGGADFVTALDLAWKALRLDSRLNHVLVIGVSAMSRYLDLHDVRTLPVYGDGAGAVVLSAGAPDGVLAAACRTVGQYSHDVGVFAGGTRTPITPAVLDAGLQNRLRVLHEYREGLPGEWAHLVGDTLSQAALSAADVQHWLWTHPSRRAVQRAFTACAAGAAEGDAPWTIAADGGYTGAAGLPMALDAAVRQGRVQDGDVLVLASAGAGVAMGAAVLRWSDVALV
jgi:3-oxoacyl-[acyl-carrier-protein] synthase III